MIVSEFKRAFVRKPGYIVAALVIGACLSLLGVGEAKAQATVPAGTCGPMADGFNSQGGIFCSREEAYNACSIAKQNRINAGYTGVECTYQTPGGANTTAYARYYCARTNGTAACTPAAFYWKQECPSPKVWDEATKTCKTQCSTSDPPLSGGWVPGDWQNDTSMPTSVCKDGCAYDQPIGGTRDVSCVDGQCWTRTNGFTAAGRTCTAGDAAPSPDTPPPDADGDGKSDGNDPSPHNPGESGDTGSDPPGGDGNGDGEGSGNGNQSVGGANCGGPPSSSGDQIGAMIAYQTWATRCAVESLKGANGAVKVTVEGGGTGEGGDGTDMGPTNSLLDAIKANTKKGEGNGGGCTPQGSVAGFSCSGDPVGCIQAEKAAIAVCREQAKDSDNNGVPDWMQGDEPDLPGDGDGDFDDPELKEVGIGVDLLDTSDLIGGGSCPSLSLTIWGKTVSSGEIPQWCNLVAIMRAVVLLMAAFISLRLLMGE